MRSPRLVGPLVLACALLAPAARGQAPAVVPPAKVVTQAEARLLQALAADPRTAPFLYATTVRDGRVVLSGRVGSSAYYAAAVEVAVNSGVPFTDRLVIDTAELARVPRPAPPAMVAMPYPFPLFAGPLDPFLGMEPPLITYPPWWNAMSARRLAENAQVEATAPAAVPAAQPAPNPEPAPNPAPMPAPARPVPPPPAPGNVDPPPPAVPPPPAAALPLSTDVLRALHARPELAALPIRVTNRGGAVTLTGDVPGPVEALDAFTVARGTAGVESVEERLTYPVPPPERPNPLVRLDRPADLAAFLRHHLAHQLGEAATLRTVEVAGGRVRVVAEAAAGRDPAQLGALLRTMPLLRGFTLDVDWQGGAAGAR
jgi:hypothetical protein